MKTEEQSPVNKSSLLERVIGRLRPRRPVIQDSRIVESSPPSPAVIPAAVIPEPPVTSSQPTRAARVAAYTAAKAAEDQAKPASEISPAFTKGTSAIVLPKTEPEDQRRVLPSAFQEVKRSDQVLMITKTDLPWLEEKELKIPLAEITLAGTDNQRFYYGSAIRGKELTEAAQQLGERRSNIANNLLYSHLPPFIRDKHHSGIKLVDNYKTNKPIYNVYNPGGQRVYFMRFDELQGIPVIIRIAVCDKDKEAQVFGVITTTSRKQIKYLGKL